MIHRTTVLQLIVSLLLIWCGAARAQQIGDPNFYPRIDKPAYTFGKGPVVLIDGGHNNFHTAEGRYKPFAELLKKDGYRVSSIELEFAANSLVNCEILVIANALHINNLKSWELPTPSAFTEKEISVVIKWVSDGGALLLIADHMPFPGASKDLASAFGFTFNNGFAFVPNQSKPGTRFSRDDGSLRDHPITRGSAPNERIDFVVTFTGQAFLAPPEAESLLVFGRSSYTKMPKRAWKFTEETPRKPIEGWLQGAVIRYGKGRVAVFGEAAAFTAQLSGPKKIRIGMNSPDAEQNYKFILNLMHWLSNLGETR